MPREVRVLRPGLHRGPAGPGVLPALAARPLPKTIYVREDRITGPLDDWIGGLFDAEHLEETVDTLHRAGQDPAEEARRQATRQALAACEDKLAKYRQALDAGVDSTVVGGWIAEVELERRRLQAQLGATGTRRLSREEIRAMVAQLGEITGVLREADPRDKAEIYAQLGIRMTYQVDERVVGVEARPLDGHVRVEGVRGGT